MQLSNSGQGYGMVAILLHWLVALMVIGMFALGLWMVDLTYYHKWYQSAPHLHKSIGVLLLYTLLFRTGWRLFNPLPEPLPNHSKLEKSLAKAAHRSLYLLLYIVILTGYLIATADGRAVKVFDWFELPAAFSGIENQEDTAGEIHFALAVALLSLTGLHALAALKHQFIDRDSTLRRMFGHREPPASPFIEQQRKTP